MNSLILSQTSVYRLHLLANKLRAVTGIRHKLSNDGALVDVLHVSSSTKNSQVKYLLAEFIDSLTSEQLKNLQSHGIELSLKQAS